MSRSRRAASIAVLLALDACNALLGNDPRQLATDAGSETSNSTDAALHDASTGDATAGDAGAGTDVATDVLAPADGGVPQDAIVPDAAPSPDGSSDAQPDVSPTRSFFVPMSGPFTTVGFVRDTQRTIAAEDPATIYYTTDGGVPDLLSPHGTSPLTLTFPDPSTVRWFAFNGAAEPVQSAINQSDSSQQAKFNFLVENATLDGISPVVVAHPLAQLVGSVDYQVWDPQSEIVQLTYAIEGVAKGVGCIYAGQGAPWPGNSGTAQLPISAPSQTGLYLVSVGYYAQADCNMALGLGAGTQPTVIGVLVVR